MPSDQDATTQVLHHQGADIAFEISGTGPPLLVLAAGMDGAAVAAPLASHLADHFTTIRFDRRGVSRSATATPSATSRSPLECHAEDAAALLTTITSEPAFVFGASIGALVGLELLRRHPAVVRRAVLHEPPIETLEPDPPRSAKLDEVRRLASDDPVHAVGGFGEIVGSGDVREPDAPEPARMTNPVLTLQNFFHNDFDAVRRYTVDTDALRTAADRLTITSGLHSAGRFEARCSRELAGQLDTSVMTIPTGHNPVADFPRGLATFLLSHLLGATPSRHEPRT